MNIESYAITHLLGYLRFKHWKDAYIELHGIRKDILLMAEIQDKEYGTKIRERLLEVQK